MKIYVNARNICVGNVNCYRPVAVVNGFGWQMGQYESGIKTMK